MGERVWLEGEVDEIDEEKQQRRPPFAFNCRVVAKKARGRSQVGCSAHAKAHGIAIYLLRVNGKGSQYSSAEIWQMMTVTTSS